MREGARAGAAGRGWAARSEWRGVRSELEAAGGARAVV